ncbi:MAG: esterase family protein, partial [Bacillota bacterium]|nr:esterase family protein [Bacillota bacterium]
GGFRMIRLNVGKSDRRCGDVTYAVHKRMEEKKIDHIFYDMPGGHETKVWQHALYNFGKRLFR